MRLDVNSDRYIVIKEVHHGVLMETLEGNQICICMRDDTFEINVIPRGTDGTDNWHRVNMQNNTIVRINV